MTLPLTRSALGDAFLALAASMAADVQRWPRRQPGTLMLGKQAIRYADLHSLYWQIRQIFGERLYDFAARGPAPHIIDCGAHVGIASLAFKDIYPAARIQAFEADSAIADMCARNLHEFGHGDVSVTAAAVWTHGNGVSFAASQDDAGHVSEQGAQVPSVRLADLLAEGPVDLVKLDVEGAEFALLADCREQLANVHALVIEVHAFNGEPVGALLSLLENAGFRMVLGDLHQAPWMTPGGHPPFAACKTDRYYFTVFAWRGESARSTGALPL